MAQPFFAAANRFATVFGGGFYAQREFEMTVPLNQQVPFQAILDMLDWYGAALWLDGECVLVDARCDGGIHHQRYQINLRRMSGRYREFIICQAPGTTERGAPLPALEYFLTRLTNDGGLHSLWIGHYNHQNSTKTLDISQACFSNLLQTSRSHEEPLQLVDISLTAEQTTLLLAHDAGPFFVSLYRCRFHGPTLLQLGSAAHLMGRGGGDLDIALGENDIGSIAIGELTALLLIPHLRSFCPFSGSGIVSYENVKKLVSALAANKISRLESLHLDTCYSTWEKEDKPSAWIDLWMAVRQHPSLKEILFERKPLLLQHSWWQPIAEAVKENPRLVHVGLKYNLSGSPWQTELAQHVEPLLERNRYRPKIAALCCTDPSKAAVLLGQAIVAISHKKNAKCRREILRMLLDQLVLTGYDFGVGVERVFGKKRPMADDTVVVVTNE